MKKNSRLKDFFEGFGSFIIRLTAVGALCIFFILLVAFGNLYYDKQIEKKQERIEPEIIKVWCHCNIEDVSTLNRVNNRYNLPKNLLYAMAIQETACGTYTIGKNNYFNIKNGRGGYQDFESVEEAGYRVAELLTESDYYVEWRETGLLEDLGKVWAEDPLWSQKIYLILKDLDNE